MRICLAGSAGGHLTQLLTLQEAWDSHDVFFVTTTEVVREELSHHGRVYVVGECNRQHLLRVFLVLVNCIRAVRREKPDVVISTGAAAGCLTCFLGKLMGAKVVWLDSITNVERLSLSGWMVRHIAALFLVQWPDLAKKYPGVEYVGPVI